MDDSELAVCLIVPVLNGEQTLVEALESVVAQTIFDRVQTIIVDNGSTDRTAEIAADYADRYDNIQVTTHIGGGCGGARNAGLQLADRPYVAFLDADDLLTPTSIERRLELMESTGADLVVGAMETFPQVKAYTPKRLFAEDRVVDNLADAPELVDTINATNKLYRRSFFDSPDNLYLEDVHFEDIRTSISAFVSARRIAVLSEVCYRYRRDPNATSIMTNARVLPANFWDHLRNNALAQNLFGGDPATRAPLDRHLVRTIREYFVRAPGQLPPSELRAYFDEARQACGHYTPDQVAEHLLRATWAVSFYAVLADDFELFSDPDSHRLGVETLDGQPFLRLDRPVTPELRELLRIRPLGSQDGGEVRVTIDSAHPARRGLVEIRGTVEAVHREHPYVPPVGYGLALEFGDTTVNVPISLGASLTPRSMAWTAQLDPGDLPEGQHRVRVSSTGWVADRRAQVAVTSTVTAPGIAFATNKAATGTFVTVTVPQKRGLRQAVTERLRRSG
ncbi:MAG: hypothetical protein JWR83_267 [Aeromicrobium sp.]|nr:hypothetical protein [Aeromicrobium sp.]